MINRYVVIFSACALALGVAAGVAGTLLIRGSSSTTPVSCPHIVYGADGTAGPLFCRIPNPPVLSYYERAYPWVFALGSDASPDQVGTVLRHHITTYPITCDAYYLASAIRHWHFGLSPLDACTGSP